MQIDVDVDMTKYQRCTPRHYNIFITETSEIHLVSLMGLYICEKKIAKLFLARAIDPFS